MEYQKIANLLNNESNQPSKFKTRNWAGINDETSGICSPNKQMKFKTSMLRSSLCDYSDAYILVKGDITVNNAADSGAGDDDVRYLRLRTPLRRTYGSGQRRCDIRPMTP